MASSVALRRPTTSSFFFYDLLRLSSVFRSFSSNSVRITDEDSSVGVQGGSDRSVSRRRDSSPFTPFFTDVFDPILPGRSLAQTLRLMDQFLDNPFVSGGTSMGSPSTRRGWDVKGDDDTLVLRVDMPGISKEDVKISVQNNTLIIRGEAQTESEDEESSRRYSSRMDLPPSLYKVEEIKAEMKNGVLKVIVPKVKEEESRNVVQIKVD